MSYVNTIFNQLLDLLPRDKFQVFIGQHKSDRYVKKLSTWNQLTALLYAQATGKESLRDIETGLSVHVQNWYHLGIKSVSKSTLSDANNRRDFHVFEELFYALLNRCKILVPEGDFKFNNPLYSIDSTTIKLCLSLFDWAKFTHLKGALKLHTLLNNRSMIPEMIIVSDGKKGDLTAAKEMSLGELVPGSIVVFDRAYIDYSWWEKLGRDKLFFVSRTKKSLNLFVVGQHNKNELEENVLADETVILGDFEAMEKHPEMELRRIEYLDKESGKIYSFLTNNFELPASQIAYIYKQRWQIELFFKWIKQNLSIKSFLGTSKNAVLSQIWIAMIYYLLLCYIKFQTKLKKSLLEFTRIVKETLMTRVNLIDLLSLAPQNVFKLQKIISPQLSFF